MPDSHIDIDPDGDTLIVLKHSKTLISTMIIEGVAVNVHQFNLQSFPQGNDSYDLLAQLTQQGPGFNYNKEHTGNDTYSHFKVSMKHLALASPRVKKMLQGNYAEAQPGADGLRQWSFEPIFDPFAFEVILNAIHGHTSKLPRTVNLATLAQIAAIVDDLDCPQSLWFFAKTWIAQLNRPMQTLELSDWILISYVFDEPQLFKLATQKAILTGTGPFVARGSPIRPKIMDKIDASRKAHIKQIIKKLGALIEDVRHHQCSQECKSLVFGSLTLHLMSAKLIFPSPSSPFHLLALDSIQNTLRNFKPPSIYRPSESLRENSRLSRDMWLVQDATKDQLNTGWHYNARGLLDHDCSLRSLITSSLDGLVTTVSGLELSDFR